MRYWVGVASKEHVQRGIQGGFAQVCHGKPGPLRRMQPNDWIIYYSPVEEFGGKNICQKFTAIGRILENEPYLFKLSKDFTPWRRDVLFLESGEVSIRALINDLSFITNKQKWGYPFRKGCFEIAKEDFLLIAKSMGIFCEPQS